MNRGNGSEPMPTARRRTNTEERSFERRDALRLGERLADAIEDHTKELRKTNSSVVEAGKHLATIANTLRSGAKFVNRWGWLVILAGGALIGASPTALKAVLAVSGHPIPQ